MSPVALAVIYDDPQGVMRPRITPALPVLTGLFASIAVQAGQASDPASLNLLRSAGAVIGFDAPDRAGQLGAARTATVQRALQLPAEHPPRPCPPRDRHSGLHRQWSGVLSSGLIERTKRSTGTVFRGVHGLREGAESRDR
jgi:hypothetical protein